jgi:hypothetical protein
MKSHLTDDFRNCFEKLPERIKRTARKNYKIWKENQNHPGLDFKSVGNKLPVYSIRVSIGWRACGVKENDTIIWFWIGSHEDYNNLLKRL